MFVVLLSNCVCVSFVGVVGVFRSVVRGCLRFSYFNKSSGTEM